MSNTDTPPAPEQPSDEQQLVLPDASIIPLERQEMDRRGFLDTVRDLARKAALPVTGAVLAGSYAAIRQNASANEHAEERRDEPPEVKTARKWVRHGLTVASAGAGAVAPYLLGKAIKSINSPADENNDPPSQGQSR